jgi:hypothetical protein
MCGLAIGTGFICAVIHGDYSVGGVPWQSRKSSGGRENLKTVLEAEAPSRPTLKP